MPVTYETRNTEAYKKAVKHFVEGAEKQSKEWLDFANARESLILITLSTGYPPHGSWGITEENYKEMYNRIYMHERVYGSMRMEFRGGDRYDMFFTPEEVKSFIGLETNAGSKTTAKFNAQIIARLRESAAVKLSNAS